jgi:diadenosine tetraphosphate (Ap4A) HIT family hydrolase
VVLWEGQHYLILADQFPRCTGHVLIVTKGHYASHMRAPAECLPELEAAQERVRAFLLSTFGRASFFENGGRKQEVFHAHLHGLPMDARAPRFLARPVTSWQQVRSECERTGFYFYAESRWGRYVGRGRLALLLHALSLRYVVSQLVEQTEARRDSKTGDLVRGGAAMIARTVELWQQWSAQGEPGRKSGA